MTNAIAILCRIFYQCANQMPGPNVHAKTSRFEAHFHNDSTTYWMEFE